MTRSFSGEVVRNAVIKSISLVLVVLSMSIISIDAELCLEDGGVVGRSIFTALVFLSWLLMAFFAASNLSGLSLFNISKALSVSKANGKRALFVNTDSG